MVNFLTKETKCWFDNIVSYTTILLKAKSILGGYEMSKNYPKLFSPIKLGNKIIKNRIVMPAMGTNYANADGSVSRRLIDHYTERAKGGTGLIVVEVTAVDYPKGKTIARQVKLNDYNDIPGWRDLADSVHAYDAKIICQLHHAGILSNYAKANGFQPVGPSEVNNSEGELCRAMTTEEVDQLIQKFIQSALFAKKAGLDGVEIHAGHGYLIGQFLSKLFNHRTDKYGGSLEGRAEFLLSTIKGVREACGKDFIISVRFGIEDTFPGGNTLEEGIEIGKLVDKAGTDLINITTGVIGVLGTAVETQNFPEGSRIYMAEALKPYVENAVISIVGKLREPKMCEEILSDGKADMVTIGRQLLCDPYWPTKAELGRESEIRKCISCSEGCFGNLVFNESPAQCVLNPYLGMEEKFTEANPASVTNPKKVVVVGGGIAGMEAAITASKRGNKVLLLEQSEVVGGQINLAKVPPHKDDLKSIVPWFEQELGNQHVEVKTNFTVNFDDILDFSPDAVIVAAGSVPNVAPILGIEKATESWDILNGKAEMPENKKVVVIGGGTVGCETSLYLAEKGNQVTVMEMLPQLSMGQETTHLLEQMTAMKDAGIQAVTSAIVKEVNDSSIVYLNEDGIQAEIQYDFVVVSTGQKSIGLNLVEDLKEKGIKCMKAGDTKGIGNIRSAIRSGFEVGYNI